MPLGQRLLAWLRRSLAAPSHGRQALAIALLVLLLGPLYLVVGLWYDLAYAGLGVLGRGRLRPPIRTAIAATLVVVLLGAVSASSPRQTDPAGNVATPGASSALASLPSTAIAAAPSPAAPASPDASASASPEAVASDAVTGGDADDGTTGGDASLPTPAATVAGTPVAGRLPGEPDPALTPGALDAAVTQATIGSTICVSGWTATVRPSSSYTSPLKVSQIAAYGYTDTSTASYEEDHLIPLELGGAPSDVRNLWPEPYAALLPDGRDVGARVKDGFENSLKRAVCTGSLTLAAAQARIGIHWVHAFYGIPLASPSAAETTPPASPAPIATPRATATAAAGLSVTFVSLPDPAVPGSTASMTAETRPGTTCAAKVVWPSGRTSTAAGLQTQPVADADGLVSWTWNVGSTTKAGTATATVTCASVSARATFAVQ